VRDTISTERDVARPGSDLSPWGRAAGIAEFMAELTARNARILSPLEQAAVQSMRVLVAGCGTVGGSIVEPLVRLGVTDFVLADPEVFDTTNLNRQACYFSDIGRLKARVLAERVKQINPLARVEVLDKGLDPENVESVVSSVTLVFDGVDAFMALWVKYLIHQHAAERRIPVIAGSDYGGKPTLYIFDYRRDPRPFYGRAKAEDHREGRHREALRWLGIRPIPTDFLPVIGENMTSDQPWPQIVYCALGMGALGSRAAIDVVLGRRVPHVVATDVHMLMRSSRERWQEMLRRPFVLVRTLRQVRGGQVHREAPCEVDEAIPKQLRAVLEAMRLAPSIRNSQPWRLIVTGPTAIRLETAAERALPVSDPEKQALYQSLGCAIEAANAVAHIAFEPSEQSDTRSASSYVGHLLVDGWRDEYPRALGVLQLRRTTCGPFRPDRIDGRLISEIDEIAAEHGVGVVPLVEKRRIEVAGKLIARGIRESARREGSLQEALGWLRFSAREEDWAPDGSTPKELGLGFAATALLRAAQVDAGVRAVGGRLGLQRLIARRAAARVDRCGALIVLAADRSVVGQLAAGRAMMAIWLAATRANLAVQPLTVCGESGVQGELKKACGFSARQEVVVAMRLGGAESVGEARRLPLERICAVDPDTR